MKEIDRLLLGNKEFCSSKDTIGDISLDKRKETSTHGQHPYAVVISCSDSRVIPEAIFHAGIGELFTIRTAGNTIGDNELASIEYAVEHLNVPLVVVLGHTQCGAIHSAVNSHKGNFVNVILDRIALSYKDNKDELEVTKLNVQYGVNYIKIKMNNKMTVIGMLYHIDTGEVEML